MENSWCQGFRGHQSCLKQWMFIVSIFINLLPLAFSTFNYGDALSKSILYFEAQRSGFLPNDQRVTWRHHSGLIDGLQQGVDLAGGYYDAGDNIKFGLPMAFTITMLAWNVMQYEDQIVAAEEFEHALEAIKWGTDYFLKAHPQPHVLWVQVGDGSDHRCWQRPEDMITSRHCYKIDENNPGSDVAGETAAAMAASSIVFRKRDPCYSQLLVNHAQQLFEFGDKYRGKYDDSVLAAKHYYPSKSGYEDELLWAALCLYKATDDLVFLNYVLEKAESFGGTTWAIREFSWDIKYAGVQTLAAMFPMEETLHEKQIQILQEYSSKVKYYMCSNLGRSNSTNVLRTLGGLLYTRKWNNMQYVSTATFLLMVYSDYLQSTNQMLNCDGTLVHANQIFHFAKLQVDYILGSNPMGMSYLVGYGTNFPRKVHHRGASIESRQKKKEYIGCIEGFKKWYRRKGDNPNVLVGALVGGPDLKDEFNDQRGNFRQLEACTYNTAPLVGVFAKLHNLTQHSMTSL